MKLRWKKNEEGYYEAEGKYVRYTVYTDVRFGERKWLLERNYSDVANFKTLKTAKAVANLIEEG